MARKSITITIHLSELLYDVYNKTHLTSRSKLDAENFVQAALIQADEDPENYNQILRSITNAYAEVKRLLGEYLYDNCAEASNVLGVDNPMELYLLVPNNFSLSAKDNIANAIHQYIVNTAISDWFAITNKDDAAIYTALAESNIENLQQTMYKRVRPKKP